ncbi:6-phosphogluconolactonase [Devosia yakushimensis]|uniref:6-phosphogluconolactonase n=1 Tax=Devosia yakushimensis TaxID=470028 RepID=A0ABQ5U8P4_9HYPH|nr:lactonase family protein [Devosia yakushimensis]GLQ08090.1 6-phosphogluconolactonase [Devosia yakushimensis]
MPSALFYVGCCNRSLGYVRNPAGKGIAAFRLDLTSGAAQPLGVTEGIDNPTFLEVARDGVSLSAVSEVAGWNEGDITAYGIDYATGALDYLSKQPTRGDGTAHNSHDGTGRFAAIANYSGLPASARPNQSIAIYPRDPDGTLHPPIAEIRHHGTGPDAGRQERPHAHCIRWTPDNRFVVVADLGIDRLLVYRFDARTGALSPHSETLMPPGSGPRHFRFHPSLPFAYCVNELTCTLASLAFDAEAGSFTLLAIEPTLPEPFAGNSGSAIDIAAGGRHLYVGNRGHDSLAGFAIDQASGIARLIGTTPCGGHVPRDFAFDPTGTILAVANQESDLISLFRYEPESGALKSFGSPIMTGSPTAIAFHPLIA